MKMYISYFRLPDNNGSLIDSDDVLNRFSGYENFFIKRLEGVDAGGSFSYQELEDFHEKLIEMDKNFLEFNQVLAFRVAQGEDFALKEFKQFLETVDELIIFRMFATIMLWE